MYVSHSGGGAAKETVNVTLYMNSSTVYSSGLTLCFTKEQVTELLKKLTEELFALEVETYKAESPDDCTPPPDDDIPF